MPVELQVTQLWVQSMELRVTATTPVLSIPTAKTHSHSLGVEQLPLPRRPKVVLLQKTSPTINEGSRSRSRSRSSCKNNNSSDGVNIAANPTPRAGIAAFARRKKTDSPPPPKAARVSSPVTWAAVQPAAQSDGAPQRLVFAAGQRKTATQRQTKPHHATAQRENHTRRESHGGG